MLISTVRFYSSVLRAYKYCKHVFEYLTIQFRYPFKCCDWDKAKLRYCLLMLMRNLCCFCQSVLHYLAAYGSLVQSDHFGTIIQSTTLCYT